MSEFLTIQEYAKRVKVHPDTVRKAIRCGYINAFRATSGKKAPFRIPMTEIERLMIMRMERINKKEK